MRLTKTRRTDALIVFILLAAMLASPASARLPNDRSLASRDSARTETNNHSRPTDDGLIYAALGDSYSAGTGAGAYGDTHGEENDCHRSANSYPSRLAAGLGFSFIFAACHGAKIGDVIGSQDQAGQFAQVNPATNVITITIGGNDIGFARVLKVCVLSTRCDTYYGDQILERIRAIKPELVETYAEIGATAEDARLVVVGYPNIIPARARGINGLHKDELVWLRHQAIFLNSAIRGAVRARIEDGDDNIFFANTLALFRDHEACTEREWVHCLVRPARGDVDAHDSFHPTVDGHRVLAEALEPEILGKEVTLRANGLGVVAFGRSPEPTIRTLSTYFGSATYDSGWKDRFFGQAKGRARYVRFRELFVAFFDEPDQPSRLVGWTVFNGATNEHSMGDGDATPSNPMGLRTDQGIELGSTAMEIRNAYPNATFGCGEPGRHMFVVKSNGHYLEGYLTGRCQEPSEPQVVEDDEILYQIKASWPYLP